MANILNEDNELLLTPDQLTERASVDKLKLKRMPRAKLAKLVAGLVDWSPVSLSKLLPVMELSARHPYDARGFMDFYEPGRWDCESNLVFMKPIVSTGPSPGMWDGSVGYARFKAPKAGTYLILLNFSGYETTMRLFVPWGTHTAYTPTTSDIGVVTALWSGSKGQQVFFNLSCTAPYLGYLQSVQVFLL